jgi:hypothetical protein
MALDSAENIVRSSPQLVCDGISPHLPGYYASRASEDEVIASAAAAKASTPPKAAATAATPKAAALINAALGQQMQAIPTGRRTLPTHLALVNDSSKAAASPTTQSHACGSVSRTASTSSAASGSRRSTAGDDCGSASSSDETAWILQNMDAAFGGLTRAARLARAEMPAAATSSRAAKRHNRWAVGIGSSGQGQQCEEPAAAASGQTAGQTPERQAAAGGSTSVKPQPCLAGAAKQPGCQQREAKGLFGWCKKRAPPPPAAHHRSQAAATVAGAPGPCTSAGPVVPAAAHAATSRRLEIILVVADDDGGGDGGGGGREAEGTTAAAAASTAAQSEPMPPAVKVPTSPGREVASTASTASTASPPPAANQHYSSLHRNPHRRPPPEPLSARGLLGLQRLRL